MEKIYLSVLLFIMQNAAFSQDCDSMNILMEDKARNKQFRDALEIAKLILNNCEHEFENKKGIENFYYNLGYVYKNNYKFDSAIYYSEKGLAINKTNNDTLNQDYILHLNNTATILKESGNYHKAIKYFSQAAYLLRELSLDTTINYYITLSNIAQSQSEAGNHAEKIRLNETVFKLFKQKFNSTNPYYFLFLSNLGVSYIEAGEYAQALSIFEKNLLHKKDTSLLNNGAYASCLVNLAVLYEKIGAYDEAITLNEFVLNYRKGQIGSKPMEYSNSLNNTANVYLMKKEYIKAESLFWESAEIRKKFMGDKSLQYITSLSNLAVLYQQTGKNMKAYNIQKMVLDSVNKMPVVTKSDIALYNNSLAVTLRNLQIFDSSLIYFDRALSLRNEIFGKEHLDYIGTLSSKADNYLKKKSFDTAIHLFVDANNLVKKVFSKTLPFLTHNGSMNFISKNLLSFLVVNSLQFQGIDSNDIAGTYSNSLFLKSLTLNEWKKMLDILRTASDSSLENTFQNWIIIKNYLSKQYTLPLAKQAPNLKEKVAEAQNIEQQLALKSADFRRYEQSINITASDVFKALKPGESAIEFTSFRYYSHNGLTDSTLYAAIILTEKDSIPHWVYLFEEKQLKNLLFTVHPNLLYSNSKILSSRQQQYGDKLYNLIWEKIAPQLEGINTVYYSPSGILNQVALAAIPFAATSKTISSKYKLVQMGSTKNIVVQEPALLLNDIALMGGIQYNADSVSFAANIIDSGLGNPNIYTTTIMRSTDKPTKSFQYLPSTLTEVDSITAISTAATILTNVYTGKNATEEVFKKMDGNSPSVLHIATHGFYLPHKNKKNTDDPNQTNFSLIEDPMLRSGIALAGANLKWNKNIDVPNREDGIVTAYEIAQMDLSKTELAVVSACESGLGDIDGSEGVFGLQRGFKSAGVRKLILTLWQVPDKATMEFMTLFYSKWLKEKKDIHTSFADTQKTMTEKYKAEPYKWAGFVLVE